VDATIGKSSSRAIEDINCVVGGVRQNGLNPRHKNQNPEYEADLRKTFHHNLPPACFLQTEQLFLCNFSQNYSSIFVPLGVSLKPKSSFLRVGAEWSWFFTNAERALRKYLRDVF
jgi:hypothetical protein